jgi:hypothetical protein
VIRPDPNPFRKIHEPLKADNADVRKAVDTGLYYNFRRGDANRQYVYRRYLPGLNLVKRVLLTAIVLAFVSSVKAEELLTLNSGYAPLPYDPAIQEFTLSSGYIKLLLGGVIVVIVEPKTTAPRTTQQ